MSKPIYVLNGPNLNLLGAREPEIYGSETLGEIEQRVRTAATGVDVEFRQSNHEGELVDWIQEASTKGRAIILNAAAYTHTSVALRDALTACDCPVFEVHLSNPAARESFRRRNHIAPVALGSIAGLGAYGYELAVLAVLELTEGATRQS
ncbi:MAG: type II 3-dehydroquinate dehydratase [Pseudomonadota bacterium]